MMINIYKSVIFIAIMIFILPIKAQVFINRDAAISAAETFGMTRNVSGVFNSRFGGMYIETIGSPDGKPFYGYAMDGTIKGYSYYNGTDQGFHHYFGGGIRQSIWADSMAWILNSGRKLLYEGYRLTLGDNGNVVLGYSSVPTNSANNIGNTVLGALAAQSMTGGVSNTLVGNWSGWKMTTGDWNTIVGAQAGANLTIGTGNTIIGWYAGANTSNNSTGNVFIGTEAGRNELGNNKLYIANDETANPLIYGNFISKDIKFNADAEITGQTTLNGAATLKGPTTIENQLTSKDIKIDDSNPFLEFKQLGDSKYYFQYQSGSDQFILQETGLGQVLKIKDGEIYFPQLAGLAGQDLQIDATGKLIEAPLKPIQYFGLDFHTHFEGNNFKWLDITKDILNFTSISKMTVFVQWESGDGTPDPIYLERVSKYTDFGETLFIVAPPSATYAQEYSQTLGTPHVVDTENWTYHIVTENSYLTVKEVRVE